MLMSEYAPNRAEIAYRTVRSIRLKALGFATYDAYLRSAHWVRTRRELLAETGGRCALCRSASMPVVHHATYERLGAEEPSDIMVLCEDCHSATHDYQRQSGCALHKAHLSNKPKKTQTRIQRGPGVSVAKIRRKQDEAKALMQQWDYHMPNVRIHKKPLRIRSAYTKAERKAQAQKARAGVVDKRLPIPQMQKPLVPSAMLDAIKRKRI